MNAIFYSRRFVDDGHCVQTIGVNGKLYECSYSTRNPTAADIPYEIVVLKPQAGLTVSSEFTKLLAQADARGRWFKVFTGNVA